jgi:hypothetical protein
MKNLFKNFRLMALVAVVCGVASCVDPIVPDDPTPEKPDVEKPEEEKPAETKTYLKASLVSTDVKSIEIKLETAGLDSIAYRSYDAMQDALIPTILFRNGERVKAESEMNLKIEGLKDNTQYYFYFAGKTGSKHFDKIVEVAVKTEPYSFTSLLTLIETGSRAYQVYVNVPENVEADEERSIRYASCCLPIYMNNKLRGLHDTDLLYQNGQVDTRVDKTVDVNMDNDGYMTDEDGNLVVDPETGEYIQLHEPIVPGEPVIFLAGEFKWGEGYIANWGPKGDGFGYFVPMYDFKGFYGPEWEGAWTPEDSEEGEGEENYVDAPATKNIQDDMLPYSEEHPYWTGAFQKMVFTLDPPQELDAEIEVIVEDITAIDAVVTIIPDDKVAGYNYCVMDDGTYQSVLDLLCGREDWMQWLISSYFAQWSLAMGNAGPEAVQFPVSSSFFVGPLNEQSDFHIFITARGWNAQGEDDGLSQKFIHEVFTTKAKTLDPPVINVSSVEDGQHEYESKFLVKAPNKDVVQAYYGANYYRDWRTTLNGGATYASLCQNFFTADEIEKINSDEGLVVSFPSLDGEKTRLAVLGYNEEYTPNLLFEGCPAIADCSTKLLAMVPHVDSPLFAELQGDWTLSAKVFVRDYDDNNNLIEYTSTVKSKVTITDKVEVPELTEDIYDVFEAAGESRENAQMYYEDFKKAADTFNNYRLHYRNRLLCLGWYDYDIYQFSRLASKSAADLFTASDYSAVDGAMILYDFGPKWYLEIAKDGTVTVPFDQMTMPPMTNWGNSPFFVTAYDKYSNHGYRSPAENMPGAFPVEVSADRKKIVIKGVQAAVAAGSSETAMHYMNAVGGWGQADAQIYRPIISEITLTKGWTETKSSNAWAGSRQAPRNYVERPEISTEDAQYVAWKSMTEFREPVKINKVEPSIVTMDKLDEALAKYASRYQTR